MSPIEILLITVIAVALACRLFARRLAPHWVVVSALLALAACVVPFTIGTMRWQLAPACALALLLSLSAVLRARRASGQATAQKSGLARRIGKGCAVLVLLLTLVVAGALPALFPVEFMSAPSGPNSVGTTAFELRSAAPAPGFATDAQGNRDIEVLAWYPAAPGSDQPRAPFWHYPERLGPALAKAFGFPDFVFDHMRLVRSHARLHAPAMDGRHPVLIFSHGLAQGMAAQNTALFEDLASHGYIVLSLGHAGEALLVRLSNDRWITSDQKLLDPIYKELRNQRARIESILQTSDPAEGDRLYREMLAHGTLIDASIAVWKADTLAVMDQLSEVEGGSPATPFAGRMDVQRLGLIGMSFGGATAVETCADARCAAAINLDGLQGGSFFTAPHAKPVMFVANATSGNLHAPPFRRSAAGSGLAVVAGTTHLDFSDLPFLSPIFRWLGALGPIGGQQSTAVTAALTRSFFDRHVKGDAQSRTLESVADEYPGVTLSTR